MPPPSQSNWFLLLLCQFQSDVTFGTRTFSPWELKDVWFKLEQKNKEKFNFDSMVRKEIERERQELEYDEKGEVQLVRHTLTPGKLTTFYGPYYMYKGKVYKRKSYTKDPTVRSNATFAMRQSYSRRNFAPAVTKKQFPQYKPWSTTSYRNRTTFYGPYYMYKGTLFSRKYYTKEPTLKPTPINFTTWKRGGSWSNSSWRKGWSYSPWKSGWSNSSWKKGWSNTSWKKGWFNTSWKKGSGKWQKWTTIPWYNRTTIPWYNRTTSYGPFFMFRGRAVSRNRWTAEPTGWTPPWMRTKLTFRWTGAYPFSTAYWSRVPPPDYVRRRPAIQRVMEDVSFEKNHMSNPSLFSDLEISNETSSDIEANAYVEKNWNMDNYQDSEMYITLRPTIRQTYKHGFLFGKYPTVDWTNSFQDLGFLQEIRIKHQQEWTLEMLRFSFDPNYSTTPIVRPPWVPHSEVERYYA